MQCSRSVSDLLDVMDTCDGVAACMWLTIHLLRRVHTGVRVLRREIGSRRELAGQSGHHGALKEARVV